MARKPINRIKIEKLFFEKVLEQLRPGLSKRDMNPENTRIKFLNTKIATYNGMQSVVIPFNCGFACTVPADSLFKVVKKINSKYVYLEKGSMFRIRTKQDLKAEFEYFPADTATAERVARIDAIDSWKKFPSEVLDGLKLCSFSASKDLTKTNLNGVYLDKECILSSDNYRISRFQHESKIPALYLPSISVAQLYYFKNIKKYFYDKEGATVYFSGKDFIYSTILREKASIFPKEDMLSVLSTKAIKGKKILTFSDELTEAVETAKIFVEDEYIIDQIVEITIKPTSVTVEATKEGMGSFRRIIKQKTNIQDSFTIKVNPNFFKEALQQDVALFLSKNKNSIIITAHEDKFLHLLTLHS